MTISITPVYAGFLALFFIFLTICVIRVRRTVKVAMGDGGDTGLMRIQRVHGNFCEYIPLILVLMLLVELQDGPALLLHLIGTFAILGRLLHAYGVSREKEDYRLRVAAMILTFAAMLIGAFANIGLSFALSF